MAGSLPLQPNLSSRATLTTPTSFQNVTTPQSEPRRRQPIPNSQKKSLRDFMVTTNPTPSQKVGAQWFEQRFGRKITQAMVSEFMSDRYRHLDSEDPNQEEGAREIYRKRPLKWPELENAVLEWQLNSEAQGVDVTGDMILQTAQEIWEQMPQSQSEERPAFSAGWLAGYKKRHNLNKRKSNPKGAGRPRTTQAHNEPLTDAHLSAAFSTILLHQNAAINQHRRQPFVALLLAPDNSTVLHHQYNVSHVQHAEITLLTNASQVYSQDYLWKCTLVTNFEPCAMCAGAAYWANVGRVAFGASEEDLMTLTGRGRRENMTMRLPSRDVLQKGQKNIAVFGPIPGWREQIIEQSRDYWNKSGSTRFSLDVAANTIQPDIDSA